MALEFTSGDEFTDVVDGVEEVVLCGRGGEEWAVVPGAKRGAARIVEADPSGGHCQETEVLWRFPASGLHRAPELGGAIVDRRGERWIIQEAVLAVSGNRWKCRARQLSVRERLDERLTLQCVDRARKASAGDYRLVWGDLRVGVPARIQPLEWLPAEEAGQWRGIASHMIYFVGDIKIEADRDYRFVNSEGGAYRILRLERAERIDALTRAVARKE